MSSGRCVCSRIGKGDIFENSQIGEQCGRLKQHADVFAQFEQIAPVESADIMTFHEHLTGIRFHLPSDDAQQCRLARATGTHQGSHLTAGHVE